MSYKDYTLKARLSDRGWVEMRLQTIGATIIGVDIQTDTYFKVPNGRLKLRQGTLGSLITHYERRTEAGAERTEVYRYEVNPSVAAIDQLMKDHEQIGVVKKERSIYVLKGVKIHLDRLPNGEEFVEIEAMDLEGSISDSDLKAKCLRMAEWLQINQEAIVPTGYL